MMKVIVYLTEHAIVPPIIVHGELSFVAERPKTAIHLVKTLNMIADGYRAV
jgi:hypothetical protein